MVIDSDPWSHKMTNVVDAENLLFSMTFMSSSGCWLLMVIDGGLTMNDCDKLRLIVNDRDL